MCRYLLNIFSMANINIIRRDRLWSSGQSSWLQIQMSGYDSLRYEIFWELGGGERGPLSLVSKTEELLGRESSGSGLEIREYSRRDPSRWPSDTFYPQSGDTNFADMQRSFGRNSSLADLGHGVFLIIRRTVLAAVVIRSNRPIRPTTP
jgi:hypothetical protein